MAHQNQKNIFLIINLFAGHSENRKRKVETVITWLLSKAGKVEFAYTEYPGHATELAAKAAGGGFDIVVAVGGDGTVNEVAKGLIGTSVPMGIFPMGSGNGLARELGIPMNISKCAAALINGSVIEMDVCRVDNQRFLCTSGIGFDAQVADKMSKAKTRGFLRYIQLTVQESIRFKPFQIRMKIDAEIVEKKVFIVTFANAKQFGNNAFIAPSANISDGLIDVVVINPFNKIWLPVFGIGLFLKIIPKLPFVDNYRVKTIELEFAGTSIYHFDGEPGKLTVPAKISVDQKKLFVVTGINRGNK